MEQCSDFEMEGEVSMTAKEAKRLIEWLTKKGHSYEEACKCIAYVADGNETLPEPENKEDKS